MKLRQQANLSNRPAKHPHSLADLTGLWRRRTSEHLGADPVAWARDTTSNPPASLPRADDVPLYFVEEVGRRVVATVGEKRSTWRRANLYADAARQTLSRRLSSTAAAGQSPAWWSTPPSAAPCDSPRPNWPRRRMT